MFIKLGLLWSAQMSMLKPTLLLIVDGWGQNSSEFGNAVSVANTPNLDFYLDKYPNSLLDCSGEAVGLPPGQMGNSEVGHLNIGAGRIVYQDIVRIDKSIKEGSFYENNTLNQLIDEIQRKGTKLHLMGLVSDGGVHSHQNHIYALLNLARDRGLKEILIHVFLDGRDTPPQSGLEYVQKLQKYIYEIGIGKIATVSGRYYAMDRDNRWERTQLAYEAIVIGVGVKGVDPIKIVEESYKKDISDEFVIPTVVCDQYGSPQGTIDEGDGVFFFNFRADRARQLVQSLFQEEFSKFFRKKVPQLSAIATMTEYDRNYNLPVAFPPVQLTNIIGEVCSRLNIKQLRIAETEKYAHVTYFFNGGREEPFQMEDRILIPSPQEVATYDQKPEMSVYEVTNTLCEKWKSGEYDFIVCNFANLDMVGHTGNFEATIRACEVVDYCVGKSISEVLESGGRVILTADHGNAEVMLDAQGQKHTAHSQSPVAFVLIEENSMEMKLQERGILGDIAPTILYLWGISAPAEMTGKNLVVD